MARTVSEHHDIQGILRSGFGKLEEACFLLLQINEAAGAKAWLAAIGEAPGARPLAYRVTHIGDFQSYQERALQVAFTAPGMRKLGAPDVLFQGGSTEAFSRELRLGMADQGPERRSHRLGDVAENAPPNWDWGGGPTQMPDVLVMLYAEAGRLSAFKQIVMADLAPAFAIFRVLDTTIPDDPRQRREPFGFIDGISQPEIDWKGERKPGRRTELEYSNLVTPGEFLLGYENEYGLCTHRPLLDATLDAENILPPVQDDSGKHDLGRNGSYLVFRQLEQDVSSFWRFVSENSTGDNGVALAEAMIGRKLQTGDPLIAATRADLRGISRKPDAITQNAFTFEPDPEGLACPFGAHIRRANPRTADLPGGRQGLISKLLRSLGLWPAGPRDDLISSSRFHRIIRRGRPYGGDAARPGEPRGIYFICLNANISRQFEFIQTAWIANAGFNGMDHEADPLLGNRVPFPDLHGTDTFSLPQSAGPTRRITGLPQFVTVRGGAYFFLPGLRALRYLAQYGVTG